MIAIASAAVLFAVWWVYAISPPTPKQVAMQKTTLAQQPDLSYIDFYTAMKTPAPDQQFNELAQTMQTFYGLPGWQLRDIRYDDGQYRIQLTRQGGTLQWLTEWAALSSYALNLGSKGAEIGVSSQLQERPRPKELYTRCRK